MTSTETETGAGTALEQVAGGALALVKSGDFTLASLAKILAGPIPEVVPETPLPAVAAPVPFTEPLRQALKRLPLVFGRVMPTERRKLEMAELVSLTDEYLTLGQVLDVLNARQEAIKETVRHHQDAQAIAEGKATDQDRIAGGVARGHLLAGKPGSPFKTPVDGYADDWSQRYTKGEAKFDENSVYALYESGEMSRQEFLAMTREVRVFDSVKMQAFIRRHPLRGLAIVRKMTTTASPGASLYAPKK